MGKKWLILIPVICFIFGITALIFFIYILIPKIESPTVSGLIGVVVGSMIGFFSTVIAGITSIIKIQSESSEKFRDRISNHSLELTKMDYDLRKQSLNSTGKKQKFLAAAKVYREFYLALDELQSKGSWPRSVQNAGLLGVFELGPNNAGDSTT